MWFLWSERQEESEGDLSKWMEWEGDSLVWTPFNRILRDEEIGELASFLGMLEGVKVRRDVEDSMIWDGRGVASSWYIGNAC